MKTYSPGKAKTPEYRSWVNMHKRCYNPKHNRYHAYGGRGISVCRRWRDSFDNFLADMGPKPGKWYSIERKNNDGNYTPLNCVWATTHEQARNTSRNKTVVVNGVRMCYADADAALGLPRNTIGKRIRRGCSPKEAVKPLAQGRADDLTGRKFGRLTVVKQARSIPGSQPGQKYACWSCLCECGGAKVYRADQLKSGSAKSCGCLVGRNQFSKV